jgi:hypothetical protein
LDRPIKQREIQFRTLDPEDNQALAAMQMLADLEGVVHLNMLHAECLIVHYDLHFLTLAEIEQMLHSVGFHLDNNLFVKLRRALYYYTEETERANLGIDASQFQTTREVFIRHYRNRPHGCRDQRPHHWRHYR